MKVHVSAGLVQRTPGKREDGRLAVGYASYPIGRLDSLHFVGVASGFSDPDRRPVRASSHLQGASGMDTCYCPEFRLPVALLAQADEAALKRHVCRFQPPQEGRSSCQNS